MVDFCVSIKDKNETIKKILKVNNKGISNDKSPESIVRAKKIFENIYTQLNKESKKY